LIGATLQESVEDGDDVLLEETPVIGFWSGIVWLVGMTAVIALLSEYVVGTIEVTKLSSILKEHCS
jgi:Ca2+:H+ antiporter